MALGATPIEAQLQDLHTFDVQQIPRAVQIRQQALGGDKDHAPQSSQCHHNDKNNTIRFPSLSAATIIAITTLSISPACGMSVGHVLPTEAVLLQGGAFCCLVNNDTNNHANNHTKQSMSAFTFVSSSVLLLGSCTAI